MSHITHAHSCSTNAVPSKYDSTQGGGCKAGAIQVTHSWLTDSPMCTIFSSHKSRHASFTSIVVFVFCSLHLTFAFLCIQDSKYRWPRAAMLWQLCPRWWQSERLEALRRFDPTFGSAPPRRSGMISLPSTTPWHVQGSLWGLQQSFRAQEFGDGSAAAGSAAASTSWSWQDFPAADLA